MRDSREGSAARHGSLIVVGCWVGILWLLVVVGYGYGYNYW